MGVFETLDSVFGAQDSKDNVEAQTPEWVCDDPLGKLDDRTDMRWAHPEMRGIWATFTNEAMLPMMTAYLPALDHSKTYEERLAFANNYNNMFPTLESTMTDDIEWKRVEFGGCDEEPDYTSNALICWPKERGDKPLPVIFYVVGGSTVVCQEGLAPAVDLVHRFGCAVVVPHYRTCVEAPYPAAINDLHAAYKHVVESAGEYGIKPDNILLMGASTGGQLGLCLAFRLKRYGFAPRGMMAFSPICEERAIYPCASLYFPGWNGDILRYCYREYLGKFNNSPLLGPEGMANRATVEDCKGLCPVYIYNGESDPDRDGCIAFAQTCYEAGAFCDLQIFGGGTHGTPMYKPLPTEDDRENAPKPCYYLSMMVNAEVEHLLKEDLRRPWLAE